MVSGRLIAPVVSLVLAAVASFVLSPSAFADNRSPLNAAEQHAYDLCYSSGSAGSPRGAIWFTNSSDYYDSTVVVTGNTTSVDVAIRGSVYGCTDGSAYNNQQTYAIDIQPQGANAYRLTDLTSTTLNRGKFPSTASHNWTSQGSNVGAKLNIAGIATLSDDGDSTGTIDIDLYRCFYANGSMGACYAETITVTVIRKKAYNLVPEIQVGSSGIAVGNPVNGIQGTVENTGTDSSYEAKSRVVRFVLPSSTSALVHPAPGSWTSGSDTDDGCDIVAAVIANGETSCGLFGDSSETVFPGGANTSIYSGSDDLSGVPLHLGDRVCYVTVVNRYTNSSSVLHWRYSESVCVRVGKTPSVQVWGNDIRVGSGFTLAQNGDSIVAGAFARGTNLRYYGSWGEYGIVAPRSVSGIASSSALNGGSTSGSLTQLSALTFANSPGFGNFAVNDKLGTLPDIAGVIDDLSNVTVVSGNPTGWVGGAKWAVVDKQGATATIAHNITAPTDAYASEDDMPQMIIIADRINIHSNVTHIDAWLVATDAINTCANAPAALTASTCTQPLTINGPVIAKQLLLRRTYGSDSADPASLQMAAETINLPASTYIWAHNQATTTGELRTIGIRELPPRY